jgi:hypothetical protein
VLERVLVEAWDLGLQQVLATVVGRDLQMGQTIVEGQMVPRLENRRVRLPHRAHPQIMNRLPNVRPHLQPPGLLGGHVNCEL